MKFGASFGVTPYVCMVVQIHTGSPWIQSRPVFVLVQQQPNTDVPLTYTLKTKVSWTAAEDELSKVSSNMVNA